MEVESPKRTVAVISVITEQSPIKIFLIFQWTQCSALSVEGAGQTLEEEGVSLLGCRVSSHQAPAGSAPSSVPTPGAHVASQAPAVWVASSAPGSYSTWQPATHSG